jgi:hypothetical protein
MRPEGWSRYRYVCYAVVKILFILYLLAGLVQIGLAACMLLLGDLDYMGSLFKHGFILILVAVVIGIWEYNLRPEVKDDDEPFY